MVQQSNLRIGDGHLTSKIWDELGLGGIWFGNMYTARIEQNISSRWSKNLNAINLLVVEIFNAFLF
jgi:hypothetical protein